MKIYVELIFLILLLNACREFSIESFETVETIVEYDSIYSDKNSPFNAITDMQIVDNIIVTKHAQDEYHFSFIDVNNKKMLRRWGKVGRGPEEYVQIGSGFDIFKSQLVFLDATRKEINYVSLQQLLHQDNTLDIIKENYPYTVDFRPMHIEILENKKIATGAFKQGYFGVLDSQNNIIENSFDYPFPYEGITGIERGSIYQTKIKSNIQQNKFVIQTLASDIFEIYQITDNHIEKIYQIPFKHVPKIGKRGGRYGLKMNQSIAGFTRLAVSEDLICFTYSNEKYIEAYKNGLASNEILCFNWRGEKVKKYILPFPVRSFCIDEQYIYGVAYLKDESIIYRFKR